MKNPSACKLQGRGRGSVAGCLLGMRKAPGSIPGVSSKDQVGGGAKGLSLKLEQTRLTLTDRWSDSG